MIPPRDRPGSARPRESVLHPRWGSPPAAARMNTRGLARPDRSYELAASDSNPCAGPLPDLLRDLPDVARQSPVPGGRLPAEAHRRVEAPGRCDRYGSDTETRYRLADPQSYGYPWCIHRAILFF